MPWSGLADPSSILARLPQFYERFLAQLIVYVPEVELVTNGLQVSHQGSCQIMSVVHIVTFTDDQRIMLQEKSR